MAAIVKLHTKTGRQTSILERELAVGFSHARSVNIGGALDTMRPDGKLSFMIGDHMIFLDGREVADLLAAIGRRIVAVGNA